MYKEIFTLRIKDARDENKLSQYKVAEILNVKQPTIASWESGRTEPDIENIGKLAKLYCHSIDYFFGLDND